MIPPDSSDRWLPQTDSAGNLYGLYNRVQYVYDRQGETTQMTDQNQTTHDYAFDGVGRLLSDSISSFGANIATAVDSIDYAYKVCGKLLTVSSEDASGNVLNQVKYVYDSNGNLEDEYQNHSGAVDTSTSLYVGYGYDNSTTAAGGQTVSVTGYRPTTVQYPTTGTNSSRVLTYSFGTSGGTDDEINRLGSIVDGSGTLGSVTLGQTLDTVSYLGVATITAETYNEPDIGYNLLGTTGAEPNLDQFGRVADQVWAAYGAGNAMRDGYQYTYNPQDDAATKQNLALDAYKTANPSSNAPYLDQAYGYDHEDDLTGLTQGELNAATDQIMASTADFSQDWTLDGLGNWSNYLVQQGTGGVLNTTLDQNRTTSAANEITGITQGAGQLPFAQPAYDQAGNMTVTAAPFDETDPLHCTYDAWNRLINATDHDQVNISYSYDGLGRLIARTDNTALATVSTTTDYYYAGSQTLESLQAPPATLNGGATVAVEQYVWSPRYVDSPVESDATVSTYSAAGGGSWTAGSTATLYYLTDADNNVTAVTNASGVVQERYSYDAYGHATMYDGPTSAGVDWGNPHIVSSVGNTVLFAGMQVDAATGLYEDGFRWYNSSTGGYMTRDPARSGANLYAYCGDDPINGVDPSGLRSFPGGPTTAPGNGPPAPTPTCASEQSSSYTGEAPTGAASSEYGTPGGMIGPPLPPPRPARAPITIWELEQLTGRKLFELRDYHYQPPTEFMDAGPGSVTNPLTLADMEAAYDEGAQKEISNWLAGKATDEAFSRANARIAQKAMRDQNAVTQFLYYRLMPTGYSPVVGPTNALSDSAAIASPGAAMAARQGQPTCGPGPVTVGGAPGEGASLTAQQQRAVQSLQDQIAEHQQKLADYIENPDAFDNQGFLQNAPTPEIRQSIIDGRIRHLQNEISAFQDGIKKILGGG